MDRSKDNPECEGAQWITLEHTVELVRSVWPGTLSRRELRQKLSRLAEDETLRCRDKSTGEETVPYIPVDQHGRSLPKLVPEVEIELRSLQQYLFRLRQDERWPVPVSDIRDLGKEGMDPAAALERRLTARAAPAEHEASKTDAATERSRGGTPGKAFREEMTFLVGYGITELTLIDVSSVKQLVLAIATDRDWSLSEDTAHGWARTYMGWYERRNRET